MPFWISIAVMDTSNEICIRFRVDLSPQCSIGIGKIVLLEAIERSGSISKAAREIGMSYRRAWMLIEDMKLNLDQAVVESSAGGAHGGGASVTAFGKQMIERYRHLESDFQRLARTHFGDIIPHTRSESGSAMMSAVSIKRKLSIS
jgi:molybdate transport system regulatory protein